ncbi:MAG: helix-turn-helix domain-containing protein [Firmicutes bacterium]|nr:helix-turn-helix domain-containing protein [Bacillota bacterium]
MSDIGGDEVSEETKKVYDAEDIQKILGLGKTKTYEFLENVFKSQEPFRIIKIGRQYKIFKESFDAWITNK